MYKSHLELISSMPETFDNETADDDETEDKAETAEGIAAAVAAEVEE